MIIVFFKLLIILGDLSRIIMECSELAIHQGFSSQEEGNCSQKKLKFKQIE